MAETWQDLVSSTPDASHDPQGWKDLVEKGVDLPAMIPPMIRRQSPAQEDAYAGPPSATQRATQMGLDLRRVLTGERMPMEEAWSPPARLQSNIPPGNQAGAQMIRSQQGVVGNRQFTDELVAGGAKWMAAMGGGETAGEMLPKLPLVASAAGQALGQGGMEAAIQKERGEPLDLGRIRNEMGMVGVPALLFGLIAKKLAAGSGVSQEALNLAFRDPETAFREPTTPERISVLDALQRNVENATGTGERPPGRYTDRPYQSPGRQKLNAIIAQADQRVGLQPNTMGGVETPAGMVDGRGLIDSMRTTAATAGGDSATAAAGQALNAEADAMTQRVAAKAAAHPQNISPSGIGHEAPNAGGPLWITHQEYDQLLREHLTKPSGRVNQAARAVPTVPEETLDTLRDTARAKAADLGYRALNREGVMLPPSEGFTFSGRENPAVPPSGPMDAKSAAGLARAWMKTMEGMRGVLKTGPEAAPDMSGVIKLQEAGRAMTSEQASEMGYRLDKLLQQYADLTGDTETVGKIRELAMRGELAGKKAQPYLQNMARVFVRPGGTPAVVERLPLNPARAQGWARAATRPKYRSAVASAVGAATAEDKK